MIHCQYLCKVWGRSPHVLLHVDIHLSQHHLLKGLFFPMNHLVPLLKISWSYVKAPFWTVFCSINIFFFFMPEPRCLVYFSFVVNFETGKSESFHFLFSRWFWLFLILWLEFLRVSRFLQNSSMSVALSHRSIWGIQAFLDLLHLALLRFADIAFFFFLNKLKVCGYPVFCWKFSLSSQVQRIC